MYRVISACAWRRLRRPDFINASGSIESAQRAEIQVAAGRTVMNLCANNYLGLANHPAVVEAAREALDEWGYGLASVRFICGTQSIHKQLETKLSRFPGN